LIKEIMGGSAIQASSSLLAMATAHRCPQRSPVIRRSVASTGLSNFWKECAFILCEVHTKSDKSWF